MTINDGFPMTLSNDGFKFKHLLLIIALSVCLGFNSLFGTFLFDDDNTIIQDENIKNYYLMKDLLLHGAYHVRFIVRATFSLNFFLGNFNPFGYHLFNILLHILNGILLFFVAGRFMLLLPWKMEGGNHYQSKYLNLFPLFAALVFLLLPIQTETTAYLSSRSSALVTFFYLFGTFFFIRFLAMKKRDRTTLRVLYLVVGLVICAFLGYGTKKTFYTFPLMLILIYFFQSKLSLASLVKKYKLLLGLAATIPVVLIAMNTYKFYEDYQDYPDSYQKEYASEKEKGYVDSMNQFLLKKGVYFAFGLGAGYSPDTYPPVTYLLTEINVITRYYLRKCFFPFELNVEPDILPVKSLDGSLLLSFLFTVVIFLLLRKFSSVHAVLPLSATWFLVVLAPTSSIVPLFDLAAEHRTYIATPGIAMLLGFFLTWMAMEQGCSMSNTLKRWGILVLLVCMSTVVISRNADWRTALSLWSDAVRKSPGKARPHNNLGDAYHQLGWTERALAEFEEAVRLDPTFPRARFNLGVTYIKLGMLQKALMEFKMAKHFKLVYHELNYNMAVVYTGLGMWQKGVEEYKKALARKPDFFAARHNLGDAYNMLGRFPEAIKEFHAALALEPNNYLTHYSLGFAHAALKQNKEAAKELRISLKIDPKSYKAHYRLGLVYYDEGRLAEAVEEWRVALRIKPGFKAAKQKLEEVGNE